MNKNQNIIKKLLLKISPALMAVLIFSLYALTMPRTVALEDDGLFILASVFNGVAHPPGYPIFTYLGHIVSLLPFGNPAVKIHLISALFGSLSAVLIWMVVRKITNNSFTAYIAAIAFAISEGVWSQSIISEVYTLNTFLFLSVLFLMLQVMELLAAENFSSKQLLDSAGLKRKILLLSFLSGLALSNHWPLFILASSGWGIIFLLYYRNISHYWYLVLIGLFAGLLPYVWLYINSNSNVFINFYGPLDSLRSFYSFVSREQYNKVLDFSATATWLDKVGYAIYSFKLLWMQLGFIGGFFILTGVFILLKLKNISISIKAGFLFSYISTSLILALILGYDYNEETKIIFPPYLLISYVFGSIFFALGINWFLEKINDHVSRKISVVILLLIFAQAFINGWKVNYRAKYQWSEVYAKYVLDTLKPNSTLIVSGDVNTAVIGYVRYVLGYRPDVNVINDKGLVFTTRLFDPRDYNRIEKDKIILDFVKSSNEPVYFTNKFKGLGFKNHWLVLEFDKKLMAGQETLLLSNRNSQYLDYIFSDVNYTDKWTLDHRQYLHASAMMHLFSKLNTKSDIRTRILYRRYIMKMKNSLVGISMILGLGTQFKNLEMIGDKDEIILQGRKLFMHEKNKRIKAQFLNVLSSLLHNDERDKKILMLEKSIAVWNTKLNPAHDQLKSIYDERLYK